MRPAPEQRADPCQQLGELERLGEVVVGAAVEAGDLVGHARARRQQQDGQLPAARAQLAQDGEPVAFRQHHVEDEQIVLALERAAESRLPVVRDVDLVVLRFQPALDEARHLLLVLDDQDPHRACTGRRTRPRATAAGVVAPPQRFGCGVMRR